MGKHIISKLYCYIGDEESRQLLPAVHCCLSSYTDWSLGVRGEQVYRQTISQPSHVRWNTRREIEVSWD